MTDYTNDRWHVDGLTVTHDDFPGLRWPMRDRADAERWESRDKNYWALAHFARAWLAAQPKPVLKAGMRIVATLRGGAVVTGEVVSVTECGDWTMVKIGAAVNCYIDVKPKYEAASDITEWHEVTS